MRKSFKRTIESPFINSSYWNISRIRLLEEARNTKSLTTKGIDTSISIARNTIHTYTMIWNIYFKREGIEIGRN